MTEGSKGFDDDFSKFKPSNSFGQESQQSQPESNSAAQFDKYAVFRELQMEEEISNALKSPSEDFKDPSPEDNDHVEEDQAEPEQQHDALQGDLYQETRLEQEIIILLIQCMLTGPKINQGMLFYADCHPDRGILILENSDIQ